ncbi:MAG: hypothetical protein R3Y21_01365 [Mycoplasmatota bacterium]
MIVGQNELAKLVEIFMRYNEVNDYIRNILWNADSSEMPHQKVAASYNVTFKQLIFDLNNLLSELKEANKFVSSFETSQRIFVSNILISQIVLHELEHVKQSKMADINADTFETILCKTATMGNYFLDSTKFKNASYLEKLQLRREYYKIYVETYSLNPSERLANIKSFKTIVEMINQAGVEYSYLKDDMQFQYFLNCFDAYDSNNFKIGTTQLFLTEIKKEPILSEYFKISENQYVEMFQLSKSDDPFLKASFGLPLTKDEFLEVEDKRINLKL